MTGETLTTDETAMTPDSKLSKEGTQMRTRHVLSVLILSLLIAALLAPGVARAAAKQTHRESVSSGGLQGNGSSGISDPSVSSNGRYVAFDSGASNLVAGDTNGYFDVFVRDRKLHRTYRVSISTAGVQGNGNSTAPAISADGRYVAFVSDASNLVGGDTNGYADVFVRDRKLHRTYRVSVSTAGLQTDSDSYQPSISANGRYVAFSSNATNLVAGDTNLVEDVFVRDRTLHKTTRVSVDAAGVQGNDTSFDASITASGRYVAFDSYATNLVATDTNGFEDVFLRDRTLHKTVRVSVSSAGAQGDSNSFNGTISANGRFVAFTSSASDLVPGDVNASQDVFVRDRALHRTTRVSVSSAGVEGNGDSFSASISADGRSVAFTSGASNLVLADTNTSQDVFLRDRKLHKTVRVSVDSAGVQGDSGSYYAAISADGSSVAFVSLAANLVAGDTNGFTDVFERWSYR